MKFIKDQFMGKPGKYCPSCEQLKDYQIMSIEQDDNTVSLCDDCLKELNRKIVKYLDNKNIGG